MLRNNRGVFIPVTMAIPLYLIFAFVGNSFIDTVKDGTAKRNGQVIACKFKGEKASVCNERFGYIPL